MFVAERFLSGLINSHRKHPVSTDGGTWYPMASRFLGLKHHLHSPYEKSMIERTMQYVKDRTECFDDYFPCRTRKCKLEHVRNWLNLFVDYHNKEIINLKWTEPNSMIWILNLGLTDCLVFICNGPKNSHFFQICQSMEMLVAIWLTWHKTCLFLDAM